MSVCVPERRDFLAGAPQRAESAGNAHSGEDAVRAVYTEVDRAHTRAHGTIRYENVFLWRASGRSGLPHPHASSIGGWWEISTMLS